MVQKTTFDINMTSQSPLVPRVQPVSFKPFAQRSGTAKPRPGRLLHRWLRRHGLVAQLSAAAAGAALWTSPRHGYRASDDGGWGWS